MEASIEVKNLYLRLLDAYVTGDDSFMERYTAPDALVIGTDPTEWWENREAFVDAIRGQLKEFRDAGMSITPGNIQAYADGRIGWIADRPLFMFGDGSTFESRITAIMRWQDGEWKFVQQHISLGVANPDVSDIVAAGEPEIALEVAA